MAEIRNVILRNLASERLHGLNADDHIRIQKFSSFVSFEKEVRKVRGQQEQEVQEQHEQEVHKRQEAEVCKQQHDKQQDGKHMMIIWSHGIGLLAIAIALMFNAMLIHKHKVLSNGLVNEHNMLSNEDAIMDNYIFMGNPGTGKSSLLNSLIGQPKFESGISRATGRTAEASSVEARGITYVDTPGLEDIKTRDKAAGEIIKALKGHAGRCKIVFVMDLNAGRFPPAHISTMTLILEATKFRSFGILINKMPMPIYNEWMDSNSNTRLKYTEDLEFLLESNSSDQKLNILPIPMAHHMLDQDMAMLKRDQTEKLIEFMQTLPYEQVDKTTITQIKVDEYKWKLEEAESKIAYLNSKVTQLDEQLTKLTSGWRGMFFHFFS